MSKIRNLNLFLSKLKQLQQVSFSPKYLLYTNVGLSLSLSAAGDVLEQHYEIMKGQWPEWSAQRTRNMAISGVTVGVVCHYWYKFLDGRMPGRTLPIVLKKVVVDQLVCSPLYLGVFFLTLGLLEDTSWEDLKKEMKDKAHKLYLAEWIIWPPAQIFNFYCLPTRFRVLYDCTISLGYDIYTSQVKHGKTIH